MNEYNTNRIVRLRQAFSCSGIIQTSLASVRLLNENVRLLIFVCGLLCFSFAAYGKPIDRNTAKQVAHRLLKQIEDKMLTTRSSDDTPTLVYQGGDNAGHPSFYVFNGENQFVIVAGDDRATPILGYSTNGRFNPGLMPPGLYTLLEEYEKKVECIVQKTDTCSAELTTEWEALRSYTAGEYLVNTQWSQGVSDYSVVLAVPGVLYAHNEGAYNYYCPIIDGLRTPTGHGATAIGQVICYWGKKGEHLGKNFDFANMPAHIGNIMPADPLQTEIHLVADFIFQCAEAFATNYGVSSSSIDINNLIPALETFDYHATYVEKTAENEDDWNDLLKNEIENERPVIYIGKNSENEEHLFICDGYDDEGRFHINWGWGGRFDGFYALTALSNHDDLGNFEYNSGHAAVIEIYPDPVTPAIPVTDVSLNKSTLTLRIGTQEILRATIIPEDASNKNLTWTSDNPAVAIVHSNGAVIAVSEGTAEITVTTYDGDKTATCLVTVTEPPPHIAVTGITIDNPNVTYINIGETLPLTCTIEPTDATNGQVIWTSDKPSVAAVSDEGLVTAISEGLVTITAASQDGDFRHSRMFAITYPVATESIAQTRIWAVDKIYVTTTHPTPIRVYNILGVLTAQTHIPEGTHTISVPRGIYIVIANNNKPVKVHVK